MVVADGLRQIRLHDFIQLAACGSVQPVCCAGTHEGDSGWYCALLLNPLPFV